MLYRKLMLTNKCTKPIYKRINIKDVKQTAFFEVEYITGVKRLRRSGAT